MSEQPIPCPFCGCDARSDDPMLRDAGYGVCRTANCPAYTRTAFAPEIWNRRSPPAPAIDVEAVIDALMRVAPYKSSYETGASGLVYRADVEQVIRACFK